MYGKLLFCALFACIFLMEKASAVASVVAGVPVEWPLSIADRVTNSASRQPFLFYSADVIHSDKADRKALSGTGCNLSAACLQDALGCRKCLEGSRLSAEAIKNAVFVPAVPSLRPCRSCLIPLARVGRMDAGMRLPSARDDPPLYAG